MASHISSLLQVSNFNASELEYTPCFQEYTINDYITKTMYSVGKVFCIQCTNPKLYGLNTGIQIFLMFKWNKNFAGQM